MAKILDKPDATQDRLQYILSKLEGVRRGKENQYSAKCPAHDDKNSSLSISWNDKGIAVKCHRGCTTEQICSAIGIDTKDLFFNTSSGGTVAPIRSARERAIYGIENNFHLKYVDAYDYTDETGKYLYTKMRFTDGKDKKIFYYSFHGSSSYEKGKPKDAPAVLYRLPEMLEGKREGKPIFFAEGEKDVETLRRLGLCATTCGGAEEWRTEYAKYFTGARVFILPDNDEPGLKLAQKVQKDIYSYAYCSAIIPTSQANKGDITDYLTTEGHSPSELTGLLKAAVEQDRVIYAPWLEMEKVTVFRLPDGRIVNKTKDPDAVPFTMVKNIKVNADKLSLWFSKGQDYLICRNVADDKDDLYIYRNGCYQRTNRSGFNAGIRKYFPLGTATAQQINNVHALILEDEEVRSQHICTQADLDGDDDVINLQNGLYSISKKKLLPHTPDVKSTMQLQCAYREDAPRPVFDKFIRDFCSTDSGEFNMEKKNLLQEYLGLTLSNVDASRAKKLLWLYSPMGNTGKSVLMHIVSFILGGREQKYTANIPLQMMNEQSKFVVGSLPGKRLIAVGDQSAVEVPDTSLLKSLTGGDTVKAEAKGKAPIYMQFRGTIIIASNALPSLGGGDKGSHLFERFLLVPCEYHVSKSQIDANLREKLEKEADGIFMWALEGLHRLIKNNYQFTECRAAEETISEYRAQQDTMFRFITECGYEITGRDADRILRAEFDASYTSFCIENELIALKKSAIKARIMSEGCGYSKGRVGDHGNSFYYSGIRRCGQNETKMSAESPKSPQNSLPDDFIPVPDEEDVVFD